MRRHRRLIVSLCLLGLVWCQVAMAVQACCAASPSAVAEWSCHDGADEASGGAALACPSSEAIPDLGKLPSIEALPLGHDFVVGFDECRSLSHALSATPAVARDGPSLATLCRLLI